MAECFIEIFQEEIPARMQAHAGAELQKNFAAKLAEAKLEYTTIRSYVTPLRLVLHVEGLETLQKDIIAETKGPLLSAPERAIAGFLKGNGLTEIDQCDRLETPKGEALLYRRTIAGQATSTLLPKMLSEILCEFSWPKTMRFADTDFRWVRPLRQVYAVLDGQILAADLELNSRRLPLASEVVLDRFHDQGRCVVTTFSAYQQALSAVGIVLSVQEREDFICRELIQKAQEHGCVWQPDQHLLQEVAGLSECPKVIFGLIEDRFMALPDEVLRLAMKVHQKYFVLNQPDGKNLSPYFAFVTANSDSAHEKTILAGNQRVLRSRLQDAEFFLHQDQRVTLQDHGVRLKDLRFVEGLGSMQDKAKRITRLLRLKPLELSESEAEILPILAKADLVSEMVGEFPELQGVIGAYYAQAQNFSTEIRQAIAQHYAPKGSDDQIPDTELGAALAMMDKLDTIAGFASKNALPKGSGDPFAIRRAMLGVLRIMIAHHWLGLLPDLFRQALQNFDLDEATNNNQYQKLMDFYRARMVQLLRDQGVDHHVALAAMDADIAEIPQVAQALEAFIKSNAGEALKASYIRTQGILKKAELPSADFEMPLDCLEEADQALWDRVQSVCAEISSISLPSERFACLSTLSKPLDNFFDAVLINTEDAPQDRCVYILQSVARCIGRVANFDRLISG